MIFLSLLASLRILSRTRWGRGFTQLTLLIYKLVFFSTTVLKTKINPWEAQNHKMAWVGRDLETCLVVYRLIVQKTISGFSEGPTGSHKLQRDGFVCCRKQSMRNPARSWHKILSFLTSFFPTVVNRDASSSLTLLGAEHTKSFQSLNYYWEPVERDDLSLFHTDTH